MLTNGLYVITSGLYIVEISRKFRTAIVKLRTNNCEYNAEKDPHYIPYKFIDARTNDFVVFFDLGGSWAWARALDSTVGEGPDPGPGPAPLWGPRARAQPRDPPKPHKTKQDWSNYL